VRLIELGQRLRQAREEHGLTQAQVARTAKVARETLALLENGLTKELGMRKVLALLGAVGLTIEIVPESQDSRPDYVAMACATANVSYRAELSEDELARALLTGKVPARRAPHLRTLFDEAPLPLLRGLLDEARTWIRPGKLERNLRKLADELGMIRSIETWLQPDD